MRWLLVVAALLTACRPDRAGVDVGDYAPLGSQAGDAATVLFVTRLDDLLDCQLQDGFIALRSAQRAGDAASPVTALLVTRDPADTLALSNALRTERITPRFETMSPQAARRVFDLSAIPAIYLIANGRVLQEWEVTRRALVVQRSEIADALAQVRKGK